MCVSQNHCAKVEFFRLRKIWLIREIREIGEIREIREIGEIGEIGEIREKGIYSKYSEKDKYLDFGFSFLQIPLFQYSS